MAILEVLTTLKEFLRGAYKGGGAVFARVGSMFGDRNIWIVGIWVMTFFNFFAHLISSVLYTDGSQIIAAFQSLGVTLGSSIGQIIFGLEIITQPLTVGGFTWVKGLVTIVLGISTIYWWYRGNAWFVRAVTSFDPNLVNWIHITAILFLSVAAFHDQSQFYELMNLTQDLGQQVAASPEGQQMINQSASETANTDTKEMVTTAMKFVHYFF